MNKRKLGSSRRSKGRQNVKEPEVKQDLEARKDVEDEASNKTRQRPASAATQEESGGENEFKISAQYDPSLASNAHCDCSEAKDSAAASCPENVLKIRVTDDDGMQACENETKQEEPEKCDTAQKEKTKENAPNCPSELTSLSACPSADQQKFSKQAEHSHVFSVVESERIKRDDTDLFRQVESLQGNYLGCEWHVSESNMQKITTDDSKVNEEINNSIEQSVFSLPKDDSTTNGDSKPFKPPEVRHAVVKVESKNNKPTQMHQNYDPLESFILNAPENSDPLFGNLKSEIHNYQPELSVKGSNDSAVKVRVSTPDHEQNLWSAKEEHLEAMDKINMRDYVSDSKITWINKTEREDMAFSQTCEGGDLVTVDVLTEAKRDSIFVQSPLSDLNVPDAQPQDKSSSMEEQTDANLSFTENRRKLGSSRRSKGRQRVKPKEEASENTKDGEAPERTFLSDIKAAVQEDSTQETELNIIQFVSYDRSLHGHSSEVQCSAPTEYHETDPQNLILQSENLQQYQEVRKTDINVESADVTQLDTNDSEDTRGDHSGDTTLREMQEANFHPSQIQESPEMSESFEIFTNEDSESFQVISGPLTDREMSELTILNTVDASTKQEENPSDLKQDYDLHDINNPQIKGTEEAGFTGGQVHKFKGGEDGIKSSADQRFHQEKDRVFSEMKEENSALPAFHFDSQVQNNSETIDRQQRILQSLRTGCSCETEVGDATGNPEIICGTLTDQTESISRNQSEFTEKNTDDSVTKQRISTLGEKPTVFSAVEGNLEALIQRNDDHHVYKPEQSWILNTERPDHALSQMYEGGGLMAEDIKHFTGSVHQGVLSEAEMHNDSIQAPLSHLISPSDPQLQDTTKNTDEQTDDSLSFSGNRRKLGSRRKIKGKQRVKESKEDVMENTRDDEAPQTSKVSFEIKTEAQEELTKDIEHDVILPVSHDHSLSLTPSPGHSSELQSSVRTNDPETVPQSLIPESELLQGDQDERKPDIYSEMVEESVNITEQEADKSETGHGEDTIEVHSDHSEKEEKKGEVYPIQMEDSLKTEDSAETASGDATQSCTIPSGSLRDHVEISQLTVNSTDDSAAKQEEPPPKENISEASDQKQEDYDLSDTAEQLVTDFNEADSGLGQVHEFRDRVEDDVKPCEAEEDKSTPLTLQFETVPLELQSPNNSETVDEQTGFSNSGHRRKMGSSRRKKERQQLKESKEDIFVNDTVEKALEKTQISSETRAKVLKESEEDTEVETNLPMSHDSSMFSKFTPGQFFEIHSLMPENYLDTDLKSFTPETVNPPEDPHDRDADIPQGDELIHLYRSDSVAQREQEHEDQTAPTEESWKIDYQTVTSDSPENPGVVSVNLIEPSTITNTPQSEVTEKNPDDSVTNQEVSTHVEEQITFSTVEGPLEAVVQRNDDYGNDSQQTQINKTEEESTSLCQSDEGGGLLEEDNKLADGQSDHQEEVLSEAERKSFSVPSPLSDLNTPPDSHVQDTTINTDEQTDASLSFSGNRRKLGSRRKIKGKQRVKESKEDVMENTRDDEAPQTSKVSFEIKTEAQEELTKDIEHDVILLVSHDHSLSLTPSPGHSSELQSSVTTNDPETVPQSLIPESELLQGDQDERKPDIYSEMVEESVNITEQKADKSETGHGEDTIEVHSDHSEKDEKKGEVYPIQMEDSLKTEDSAETASGDATQSCSIPSGSLRDHVEMSQLTVNSTDDSAAKQEEPPPKENISEASDQKQEDYDLSDTAEQLVTDFNEADSALGQVHEFRDRVEDDVKPCEAEEDKSTPLTLQFETVPLELQSPNNSEIVDEQTGFSNSGHRRKMGSSRRKKERQQLKESKEDIFVNDTVEKALEKTQISSETRAKVLKESEEDTEVETNLPMSHDSSMFSKFTPGQFFEIHSLMPENYLDTDLKSFTPETVNPPEDPHDRDADIPQGDELIHLYRSDSVAQREQEHEDQTAPTEESWKIDYQTVTSDSPENPGVVSVNLIEPSTITNTPQSEVTEKNPDDSVTNQEVSTHVEEQITFSTVEGPLEAVVQRNDDYGNDSQQTQINKTEEESTSLCQSDEGGGLLEEDNKLADGQSDHQEEVLSEAERKSFSVPSPLSDLNTPPDSHVQDTTINTDEQTDASLSFSGNRRKLGSRRKIKGKQRVKESKEDVMENTRDDEAPQTSKVSFEIKTEAQEELTKDIEHDVILPVSHDHSLSLTPSPGHSSELQSSVTTNDPETVPQSLIPESELLQGDQDERKPDIYSEMVEESVNITEQKADKSETGHGEDTIEVHSDHSEKDEKKGEVYPIQMEDSLKTEDSAETASGDATQSCSIPSGSLRDHVEMSQLTVNSTDDSAAKQEEHPPEKNISEASDQKQEDYDLSDTAERLVTDFNEADSGLGQVHEFRDRVEDDVKPCAEQTFHWGQEGLTCEAEEDKSTPSTLQFETVPLELQSPNNSETVDEQTGFSNSGHRRKMGSSRRKKERQQLKESKEDIFVNDTVEEAPQISQISSESRTIILEGGGLVEEDIKLADGQSDHQEAVLSEAERKSLFVPSPPDSRVQTAEKEDLTEDTERDVLTVSHESSMSLILGDSSEIQSFVPTKDPKTSPQSSIRQSKNHESEATQQEVDNSDTFNRNKTRGSSSEVTENFKKISGNLTGLSEISELTMKSTDEPTSTQEEGHKKENNSEASDLKREGHDLFDTNKEISEKERESDTCQVHEFKVRVEDDLKLNAEQILPPEKEGLICETEEDKSSLSILQSERIPHSDSMTADEQTRTGFNNSGHRRKMGSSRRKKERHQVKDSEWEIESTSVDEAFKTKALALEIKTAGLEELTSDTKLDIILSVSQDSSISVVSLPGHLSEVQSSVAANAPETDPQHLTLHGENLPGVLDDAEPAIKDDIVEESVNLMLQEMEKSETFQSENTRDVHSYDALMEEQELEVDLMQMQERLQPGSSPETTNHPTENFEITSEHTEMSELTVKCPDDSAVKHEEYPAKGNISEALDLKQEDWDLYDPNKLQVSHLEKVDPLLNKVHEQDEAGDDVKSNNEQMFYSDKDGFFSELQENKPALPAFPSESVAFDSESPNKSVHEREQTNSCTRRKLGSSRRTKGRPKIKDSATETYNEPIQENEEKGSSNKLNETTSAVESAGLEKSIKTVQEEAGQKDLSHNDVENQHTHPLVWTSDLATAEVHLTSNADQKVTNKSLSPNEDPPNVNPTTDAEKSDESTECYSVKNPHGQETEQEETQKDDAAEKTETMSRNVFNSTEYVRRHDDTDVLRHLSSDTNCSTASERTSEKSSSNDHTEVEYSVVQEAHSSPQDHLLINEEQDNSPNMSTTARTHPSEDIVNNEHKDQIKPEQMPEMHQFHFSSFKQDGSSVQAQNSDANAALVSHPMENYQSNKDETHSDLKTVGSRRKLGSSRRLKGRQHAKFTEADQEQPERDVGNTEKGVATQLSATKTRSQEELRVKSVEKLETISSTEDDKLPEEESTFCSLKVPNSSTVSTSDINPVSNTDDSTESSKDTKEKHIITLINKSDSLSPLTENDSNTKDLMQSPPAFVWNRDSDMQSTFYHDDIFSDKSNSVCVPDRDGVTLHQNRGAQTPRREPLLQQANKVTETTEEVARLIDIQDPELGEVGEKCVHEDREVNTSPESMSASEEPAVDVSYRNRISTTMDASNSQDEKTHSDSSENVQEKSKQKKRKFASSRRTNIQRKQEGEARNRDETKESDNNTGGDASNLDMMDAVEESLMATEAEQGESVQPSHGTSEQKTINAVEEIHSQTPDIKTASPNSAFRRRKMGSTRKNLESQAERENKHQEVDLEIKATDPETTSGDVRSESLLKVKELQLHTEYTDSDSEQQKEKVFKTEGSSPVGGAFLKILAEETLGGENPVSQSREVETEHPQTPRVPPSTSPEKDSVSEPGTRGRRKKMGSNRRSQLQQRNKDQKEQEDGVTGAQNEVSAGRNPEEGAAEQLRDLDQIQVEETGEKDSSNISVSESEDLSKPVSEKAPDKSHPDEIRPPPDKERKLSLAGNLSGADSSNRYNVVMIGDSSVGKTSFMKRAQSGKFSLDIPASVGLDSCLWTVVVDGKPVVLQLWDTAGQERFHSITRQIFHKAQAFLLMYDITCSQSFSAVSYWANSIQEAAAENVTVLLLGNKSDQTERRVKTEEGDVLAKEYSFGFMECSAATGDNVIKALETVARMLSQRADLREETTALHKQPAPKTRSNCC